MKKPFWLKGNFIELDLQKDSGREILLPLFDEEYFKYYKNRLVHLIIIGKSNDKKFKYYMVKLDLSTYSKEEIDKLHEKPESKNKDKQATLFNSSFDIDKYFGG